MKWIIALVVIILIIGGVFYYGSKSATAPTETGPIKIGVVAPLTGEGATWGQNTLAAATLAVKEVNDAGGINGRKVELLAEDDKAGGVDATTAFTKLINVDKVVAIVGVPSSAAAGPALPIAQKAGIPVMMLASAPSLISVGDYMYRIYPADSYQGYLGADIVLNKLGKKKVAVLFVKNDYGQGVADSFSKKIAELGGEVTYSGALLNDSTDFRSEIAKAKASKAEALYLAMYPDGALLLAKQLKEAKNTLPVVTEVNFNEEKIMKSGYADGYIFTEPKSDISADFTAKLKAQPDFANLSVNIAAPFSYDATKAMLMAITNAGGTVGAKIKEALAQVSFPGVSAPTVEFGADREIKTPAFNIKQFKNKAVVDFAS